MKGDDKTATSGTETGTGNRRPEPGEGIRGLNSTTAFRAINFELYARPVIVLYCN